MVAWANLDWQAKILEEDIKQCFKTLKLIWIETEILKRRMIADDWRDRVKGFLQENYDGTTNQAIAWCWKRIRESERLLRQSGRKVPYRPLIIYIDEQVTP